MHLSPKPQTLENSGSTVASYVMATCIAKVSVSENQIPISLVKLRVVAPFEHKRELSAVPQVRLQTQQLFERQNRFS